MIRGRVTPADQAVFDVAIFGPSGRHQTLTVLGRRPRTITRSAFAFP